MHARPSLLRRPRPATATLVTALVTCTALTACAGPTPSPATSAAPQATVSPGPTSSGGTTTPDAATSHNATSDDTTGGPASDAAPTQVSIPSLKIRSSLMRLGLNPDGTVEVPPAEQGMTAGWYTGGAVPGRPGPAVLIGHNDTRFGRAVFHDLKDIAKGAEVLVRGGDGTSRSFTVTGKETVNKKSFPTERVYGATEGSTLRLITCDGAFDAEGHPVDNLIVYAEPS
ncbi:sortase (surface protein transpeptidase) [Streptomyces cavourensis]|uniref:class F sortase n=1 Tax=Streptomyces cavourensis TaxID=67258 RepID=UPI00115395BF|nr:class F sortase [Streptomyces cavourensis]TQO34023.1 sortase (surface protein transpeptidase) [Streptomyces cavourensis]